MVYINLFNGRNSPDQREPENFLGPFIGPVEVSFAFGNIRVHPPCELGNSWDFPVILETFDGLIEFDGKYYSDIEIVGKEFIEDTDRPVLSFSEFKESQMKNKLDEVLNVAIDDFLESVKRMMPEISREINIEDNLAFVEICRELISKYLIK